MGSINSEGIYEYDGTDSVTPIQTWGNLLSASVTDALAAVRADLTVPDTGWVTVTSAGGMSGNFQGRRIGSLVFLRGASTPGLAWDSTEKIIVSALPAQFQPAVPLYDTATTTVASGDLYFRIRIQGSTIGARSSRTTSSATQLFLNLCYLGD
jgi:hypothetical protein